MHTHYSHSSKDGTANNAGLYLANTAKRSNRSILNGSIVEDYLGNFTFMAGTRCSTTDFMLTNENLQPLGKNLRVLPPPPLLRLAPLGYQTYLKIQSRTHTSPTQKSGCCAIWTAQLEQSEGRHGRGDYVRASSSHCRPFIGVGSTDPL